MEHDKEFLEISKGMVSNGNQIKTFCNRFYNIKLKEVKTLSIYLL